MYVSLSHYPESNLHLFVTSLFILASQIQFYFFINCQDSVHVFNVSYKLIKGISVDLSSFLFQAYL